MLQPLLTRLESVERWEQVSFFMSEHTFFLLSMAAGAPPNQHWLLPGAKNWVFGVRVYFVNEMPAGEWILA